MHECRAITFSLFNHVSCHFGNQHHNLFLGGGLVVGIEVQGVGVGGGCWGWAGVWVIHSYLKLMYTLVQRAPMGLLNFVVHRRLFSSCSLGAVLMLL